MAANPKGVAADATAVAAVELFDDEAPPPLSTAPSSTRPSPSRPSASRPRPRPPCSAACEATRSTFLGCLPWSGPGDPKKRLVLLSPSEFEEAAAKAAAAEAGRGGRRRRDLLFFDRGVPRVPAAARPRAPVAPLRRLADLPRDQAHLRARLRRGGPAETAPSGPKRAPVGLRDGGPHRAPQPPRGARCPYSRVIGRVLLDKNPRLRVVVNKLASIQNEFRVFKMEVVAGKEGDTVAEVVQHGCRFGLDYAKVYWNSRLEAEHARLVETEFRPGQVIVDAMAGRGPLCGPCGEVRRRVYRLCQRPQPGIC